MKAQFKPLRFLAASCILLLCAAAPLQQAHALGEAKLTEPSGSEGGTLRDEPTEAEAESEEESDDSDAGEDSEESAEEYDDEGE